MSQLTEIGALWKRTAKTTGEEYLSGTIQVDGKAIEIRAFKNKYKKADNHPDFRIMVEIADDQPAPKATEPTISHEDIDADSIPF